MLVPQSPWTNRPSQAAYCAGERPVEAEGPALRLHLRLRGGRPDQQARGIARREPEQEEHEGQHAEDDGDAADRPPQDQEKHRRNLLSPYRGRQSGSFRRASPLPSAMAAALLAAACQPEAARRGATVLFASGADLQTINPLLAQHPLARQVQRYVLLTTLARYDSALTPEPYLARRWSWSGDRRAAHLRPPSRRPMARRRGRRPRATSPGR